MFQEPLAGYANTLTLGFDYLHTDEDITNTSLFFVDRTVRRFDLEKENYAIFVHDEFYPTDRLALSAGYRWDEVEYQFSPTAPRNNAGADYQDDVFTAGINLRLLDRSLNLKAAAP